MSTVLIVDDDALLAYTLEGVLAAAGHTVVGIAPSFNKAVEIASHSPPELALLDYQLDGRRGAEAVR
jgi:two-component system, response regulator PdtaR